jgi:hypothetical protein
MKLSHLAALAVGSALIGCDASAPAGPTNDPTGATLRRGGGVVSSAEGGGQAQLPAGFSMLKFSFNAKVKEDGSASGEFRQRYESAGGVVDFTGRVTCVSFDAVNNRAWVGGIILSNRSTNPGAMTPIHEPGREVWFRVVDNGQGQAPDDRTTVFGFEGGGGILTSAEYCAAQLWTAGDANTWAVVAGNIQVKP